MNPEDQHMKWQKWDHLTERHKKTAASLRGLLTPTEREIWDSLHVSCVMRYVAASEAPGSAAAAVEQFRRNYGCTAK
jgi:hypothetical protein